MIRPEDIGLDKGDSRYKGKLIIINFSSEEIEAKA